MTGRCPAGLPRDSSPWRGTRPACRHRRSGPGRSGSRQGPPLAPGARLTKVVVVASRSRTNTSWMPLPPGASASAGTATAAVSAATVIATAERVRTSRHYPSPPRAGRVPRHERPSIRPDRPRGDGRQPRAQRRPPRHPDRGAQSHRVQDRAVHGRARLGGTAHRHRLDAGVRRCARAPADDHDDGQGRAGGRRGDRGARAAARRGRHDRRRRQLALPRHPAPRQGDERARAALPRRRGLRRRGGRPARPEHHARRRQGGLCRRRGRLHRHRRAGRRDAVLHVRRRRRRGPLREDGPQRPTTCCATASGSRCRRSPRSSTSGTPATSTPS